MRVHAAQLVLAAALAAVCALAHLYAAADMVGRFPVPLVTAALLAFRVRRIHLERQAWIVLVVALALFVAGNAYSAAGHPGLPAMAGVASLANYPLLLLALGLLVRERTIGFRPTMWFDGAAATLAMGALMTHVEVPATGRAGSIAAAVVLHVHLVGDPVLASAAIGTVAFPSCCAGAAWAAVAAAIAVEPLADLVTVTARVTPGGITRAQPPWRSGENAVSPPPRELRETTDPVVRRRTPRATLPRRRHAARGPTCARRRRA
jgi:hypothetical protein